MSNLREVKFINLTAHDIVILESEAFKGGKPEVKSVYPCSGSVVRARYTTSLVERVKDQNGREIEITNTSYRMEVPLPPPIPGVFYIVSKIIVELHVGKRNDLVIVSGKLYKNSGSVIGIKGLAFLKRINED